jgi:hypothetical protein
MEKEFHQIATEEHRTKSELFREMFPVYRSYRKRRPEPEFDDEWVMFFEGSNGMSTIFAFV